MQVEKKQLVYGHAGQRPLRVAYTIVGNKDCVFSGLDIGSTINWAEDIIRAICRAERFTPRQLTFYDLQTHRGYIGKKPGNFELNRLRLEFNGEQFEVSRWVSAPSWPQIYKVFDDEINWAE